MLTNSERHLFEMAFALAYWIHVNKEIAFFIAEDAIDSLPSMLGLQKKYRKPVEQLRGFWKWGERTRPIRTTVKLNEYQMLQWLVYKESEAWERQTERGEGPYSPTEEDLIVRYIKHLVFLTVKRDSFYVTMAIGSLLHQFDRRETRLFYDILTQSDLARMKDTNYIGKQRLELLEKVSRRFGHMTRTTRVAGDEKQLVMRPTNKWVIDMVKECLDRFTPWETNCVLEPQFEVTDISGLYVSESSLNEEEEELISMNRIHTVLHPQCLTLFCEGLSDYVRTLPKENQDRRCGYGPLDQRLTVPRFFNLEETSPRGDRFQPPKLTQEDYIRLDRMLDARGHRRKNFIPQKLSIYVDGVLDSSFNPRIQKQTRLQIGSEAGFIEVKGEDGVGEVALAILPMGSNQILTSGFNGSVVHPGGKKLSVRLTPLKSSGSAVNRAELTVTYNDSRFAGPISEWLWSLGRSSSRDQQSQALTSGHASLIRAGVLAVLLLLTLSVLWWKFSPSRQPEQVELNEQTTQPSHPLQSPPKPPAAAVTPSSTSKEQRTDKAVRPVIARAGWSSDRNAALMAIPIEPTRSERQFVNLSDRETKLFLSLPPFDDQGRTYIRYRITFYVLERQLWQQMLAAPRIRPEQHVHVLDFRIFSKDLREGEYELHVSGRGQSGWQKLGHITLQLKNK